MNISPKTIALHLLGWILFLALVIGFVGSSPNNHFSFTLSPALLVFCIVFVSLFYINAYLLIPTLYLNRRYLLYFLIVGLVFIVVYFLQPFDKLITAHGSPLPPPDGPPPPNLQTPPRGRGRHVDITSVILFITVWSFSTALQIIRQWRNTERRALQAEADKVNAELSFLKAQINPHFLFNTLNNIYSLAIVKNEKTPAAIMKLSQILRYITDDVRNDFVSLQSEIECAGNYIELQKLRLSNKVEVRFSIKGETEQKQIAPLIFMTFIENAFKYGISNHEACVINISITADERSINLFCQNKIFAKELEEGRIGVGISNAKKRLSYLYPEKHLLNIDTKDGLFTVHLTIIA